MATFHALPTKDPSGVLDYVVDFTNLLTSVEQITARTVSITPNADAGDLNLVSDSIVAGGKQVQFVVDQGLAGRAYAVTVHITTDQGNPVRQFERTCIIPVEDR